MRLFLDTNVLLYTQDPSDPAKQRRAQLLLGEHASDDLVVSTQVLLEFYRNLQRKQLCSPDDARQLCELWKEQEVIPVTPPLVHAAIELHQARQLSVWDALILEAAIEAQCEIVYTEDLQHGMRVGPLEVINPFLAREVHEPQAEYVVGGAARHTRKRR